MLTLILIDVQHSQKAFLSLKKVQTVKITPLQVPFSR